MIMRREFRDDLRDAILDEPAETFGDSELTPERVVADDDLMERLWVVYQKDVEEYDCDPAWSVHDALHEVLGLNPPGWEP